MCIHTYIQTYIHTYTYKDTYTKVYIYNMYLYTYIYMLHIMVYSCITYSHTDAVGDLINIGALMIAYTILGFLITIVV